MKAALLAERGVVKVIGDDARKFLNGLLTTDIAKVSPERGAFAALLTPQGKIMVDMIKDFKDPQIFAGWLEWRAELSNALNPAFAGQQAMATAAREAVRAGDVILNKYA